MTFKRPESVLVVLYNEHAQVLVMQRDDDPDFWQSVTGTLEPSEVPLQTAYREVAEETGVILDPSLQQIKDCRLTNQYTIRKTWLYRYPADTKYNFEYVFAAQIPADAQIRLTEHTAYLWLDKTAAIEKVWSSTNADAIARFVPEVSA